MDLIECVHACTLAPVRTVVYACGVCMRVRVPVRVHVCVVCALVHACNACNLSLMVNGHYLYGGGGEASVRRSGLTLAVPWQGFLIHRVTVSVWFCPIFGQRVWSIVKLYWPSSVDIEFLHMDVCIHGTASEFTRSSFAGN